MIVTGNIYFKRSWEIYKLTDIVPKMASAGLTDRGIDMSYRLKAYINHGRWCVRCQCGGSEYAWEEGIFMCQSCWNETHGHRYGLVEFPAEREAIEQLLEVRRRVNRNWYPGETAFDLERENALHRADLLEVT